jgi:hypothetical protein
MVEQQLFDTTSESQRYDSRRFCEVPLGRSPGTLFDYPQHLTMCLSIAVHHPDLVLAEGEHLGFKWTVIRNTRGYRCGYVRVPVGHPWHGQDYDDVNAECHGGLTFSQADEPCTAPGPDDAWWLGFDCAHSFDAPDPTLPLSTPPEVGDSWFITSGMRNSYGVIRSQHYVEAQCFLLCAQAAAALEVKS